MKVGFEVTGTSQMLDTKKLQDTNGNGAGQEVTPRVCGDSREPDNKQSQLWKGP